MAHCITLNSTRKSFETARPMVLNSVSELCKQAKPELQHIGQRNCTCAAASFQVDADSMHKLLTTAAATVYA